MKKSVQRTEDIHSCDGTVASLIDILQCLPKNAAVSIWRDSTDDYFPVRYVISEDNGGITLLY